MKATSWTIFGPKLTKPSPHLVPLVLAFFFAAETFLETSAVYPIYMSFFAFGGAGWALQRGLQAKAYFSFVPLLISLPWLNPLVGGDLFNEMSPIFFASHALLAMAYGVSGYTFWASERKPK